MWHEAKRRCVKRLGIAFVVVASQGLTSAWKKPFGEGVRAP